MFPDLGVVRVLEDAPSADSGIEPGDRLVSFDGRRFGSLADREVPVEVRRGGEPHSFTVKLGDVLSARGARVR